jgi:hypothetical protein
MAAMKGKYCFLMAYLWLTTLLGALDFQIPKVLDISGFGTILADQVRLGISGEYNGKGRFYGMIPRSDVQLISADKTLEAPSSGTVFYSQVEANLPTVFSFPLGGALAVIHPDKFVSLTSGLDSFQVIESSFRSSKEMQKSSAIKKGEKLSGGVGSGVYTSKSFGLRLFDVKNELWMNTIFLAPWIEDNTSPIIRSARLIKAGTDNKILFDIIEANKKERRITCPQGAYSLFVDARDIIISNSHFYSAPYRIEAILDGEIVINASFMAARASGGGISFLGNPPPSQRAIGEDCSYQTGQFIILRGKHDFLLQVNDFAGNQTDMRISITSY